MPESLTFSNLLRQIDLGLLALALPIFLLADLPIWGYVAGAGAWLVQRTITRFTTRRAAASDDVRTTVGLMAGSMIGRGWLVALTIFAVGVIDSDRAGLSAAVLILALFTVSFSVTMILRPFETAPGEPTV